MEKLLVLLAAITLIVLGARGTYKALWNQFFPNEPIVTTPVNTQPGISQVGNAVSSGAKTVTQGTGSAVSAGANAVKKAITGTSNSIPPGSSTTGNNSSTKGVGNPYPPNYGQSQSIPVVKGDTSGIGWVNISASNAPNWWPSWLPYPGDNPFSGW